MAQENLHSGALKILVIFHFCGSQEMKRCQMQKWRGWLTPSWSLRRICLSKRGIYVTGLNPNRVSEGRGYIYQKSCWDTRLPVGNRSKGDGVAKWRNGGQPFRAAVADGPWIAGLFDQDGRDAIES